MEVEIGRGKKGRRAYGFDDIAIVPSRRTRDPDDIDITAQQNLLVVQGKKRDEHAAGEMLHLGIANRGFERRFELADYVRVASADLADGLLVIDLVREIPEAMKPKKIALNGQRKLEVVEQGDKQADAA